MKKPVFYTELAYVLGIVFVAMGAALMDRADFGMSMVVAPAYLLYRWLGPVVGLTFGTAEYCFQALLLFVLALVLRRFRLSYLFSFVTAVIYGFVLDLCMAAGTMLPAGTLWLRGLWYVLGLLSCAFGVSMMFHTYFSPEVYELFVKELSSRFGWEIHRVKTAYDCVSCAAALGMSFLIFGPWQFIGVKAGTILCALVNGWTIGRFSSFFEARFDFRDALPWRPLFTGVPKERPTEPDPS